MQTGHQPDPFQSHRDALLLGAVRVFCTFVQHDVSRMLRIGFDGDPEIIFRAAVKHQMLCGQGRPIANIVTKIIEHATHTPLMCSDSEKKLLACIMNSYNEAKSAVENGPDAYENYKNSSMIPGIMSSGSTIFPLEDVSDNVDTFINSVRKGIDAWPAFEPKPGFETIVHRMV